MFKVLGTNGALLFLQKTSISQLNFILPQAFLTVLKIIFHSNVISLQTSCIFYKLHFPSLKAPKQGSLSNFHGVLKLRYLNRVRWTPNVSAKRIVCANNV